MLTDACISEATERRRLERVTSSRRLGWQAFRRTLDYFTREGIALINGSTLKIIPFRRHQECSCSAGMLRHVAWGAWNAPKAGGDHVIVASSTDDVDGAIVDAHMMNPGEHKNASAVLNNTVDILMKDSLNSTILTLKQQLAYPLAAVRPQQVSAKSAMCIVRFDYLRRG